MLLYSALYPHTAPLRADQLRLRLFGQRSLSPGCLDTAVVFSSVLTQRRAIRNPASSQTMATVTQDAAYAVDPLLYRLPEFPAAIPIAPTPAMSPCDSDGIAAWITISGDAFPAMVLGGEPRIPINLLLNRVLLTQGVSEIQTMMDDLNIHKSVATNEQAERLRKMDPEVSHDIAAVSLVTRTDAERICGIVRVESDPAPDGEPDLNESERLCVQHQLFGTVNGWVYPSRKGGRSVRCRECDCFFTPEDFVAHSHSDNRESQRTVHWGFDPANWRFMLELAKPSSESAACQEQWKQFLSEKTDCKRKILEESNPINKAKRSIADQIEDIPLKVARSSSFGAKPDPLCADASYPLKAHLRDSLSRFFGSLSVDPFALLSDTMQKETAFKVKSLAGISEQPSSSGVGQLIKLDSQPIGAVPEPSAFMLVEENLMRIKSSCDKLEAVEFALKQSAAADPAIIATLRDVRVSLSENNGGEYRRLRNAYEFLFAMYRQSCDPLGCSNDPLVRAAVAAMRADQIALGVAMNTNPNSVVKARQYSDLVQQQIKLAEMSPVATDSSKALMSATMPASLAASTMDSNFFQTLLVQQLMQFASPPQLTQ